jgi:hypothetical protein
MVRPTDSFTTARRAGACQQHRGRCRGATGSDDDHVVVAAKWPLSWQQTLPARHCGHLETTWRLSGGLRFLVAGSPADLVLMRLRLGPPRWWSGWQVTSRLGEARLAGLR